jgi:hypothetical protein
MEDAIEEFDLLNRKLVAVITEVAGELINVRLRNRINTEAKRHTSLSLATSIDTDQSILEGLRVIVDGVAALQAPLGFIHCIDEISALFIGEYGNLLHGRHGDDCGTATMVFTCSGRSARHICSVSNFK